MRSRWICNRALGECRLSVVGTVGRHEKQVSNRRVHGRPARTEGTVTRSRDLEVILELGRWAGKDKQRLHRSHGIE